MFRQLLAFTLLCISAVGDSVAQDCTGVFVQLVTQAEVNSFQANHGNGGTCKNFTGHLYVGPSTDIANLNGLSALTSVQGSLVIEGNEALTTLAGLAALKSVHANLVIAVNPILAGLGGLEQLELVGENLDINNNDTLAALAGPPKLGEVGRYLTIGENKAMTSISGFGALHRVGWSIQVTNNNKLATVGGFGILTSAGGVYIAYNAVLNNLSGLKNITSVEGGGFVLRALKIQHVDWFDKLTQVGGTLSIDGNPDLLDLDGFAQLAQVDGDLTISSNALLTNLNGISGLDSLGGGIYLHSMPVLTDLDGLSGITGSIDALQLELLGITTLSALGSITEVRQNLSLMMNEHLVSINGFNSLARIGGELTIQSNPTLASLDGFKGLLTAGGVVISDNAKLVTIKGLSALESGSLGISFNPSLNSVSGLANLKDAGWLSVWGTGLANLSDFARLNRVVLDLNIGNNPKLVNLVGLGELRSVGRTLLIDNNDAMTSLTGLFKLTAVGDDFHLTGNNELLDVGPMPALTVLGGNLTVLSNPKLRSLSGISRVTQIGRHVTLRGNTALRDIGGFSGLQEILGSLEIRQADQLENLDGLLFLETIGQYFELERNNGLKDVDGLRNLRRISGDLYIRDNDVLENLNGLHRLHLVGDQLILEANDSLGNCRGLVPALDDIDDGTPGPGFGDVPDIKAVTSIWQNGPGCSSIEEVLASEAIAELEVAKQFSDSNPTAVPISFACDTDDLRLLIEDGDASIGSPALAVVRRYIPEYEPHCVANEAVVPTGYEGDDSDCADLEPRDKEVTQCVVTNQQLPVPLAIGRVFSDANPAPVQVSVDCNAGDVTPVNDIATATGAAAFTVVNFHYAGSTCEATATIPSGYSLDANGCIGLAIAPALGDSCVLAYKQEPVLVTVHVAFEDESDQAVQVGLSCGSGTVAVPSAEAKPGQPATFTVRNFPHAGTSCTARVTSSVGYGPVASDCEGLAVQPGSGDSCLLTMVSDQERVPILEALTGSWYEPSTSGQGFMMHSTGQETLVMYFYGYDEFGERLWLLSQSEGPFAWGEPIPFETHIASGGGFQQYDKNLVAVEPWGVAEVTLQNCHQGTAYFNGPQGEKTLEFVRLGDVAGSDCKLPPVPEETASVSGSWYEQETSGQGFSIHKVSADRGVAYFYGYDDEGGRLWLIGTWNEPFEFGKVIEIPMKWVTGGSWDVVDPEAISRDDWGTLSLRFDDCDTGEAILDGVHGRQELDLTRLAGAFGLECHNPAP